MIYQKDPRFIFIHIPKTGGTSIETVLAKHFLGKDLANLTLEEGREYALPKKGAGLQHNKLAGYVRRYQIDLDDFFTFAIVRNPWDLVLSEIRYFQKHERKTFVASSFAENVRILVNYRRDLRGHDFSPQVKYLRDRKGRQRMSYLGRFETLAQDTAAIFARLGIPPTPLPMIFNTSQGQPHYREVYDDEARRLVAGHFAEDIETFGYTF